MERGMLEQQLYGKFQDLRIDLYQAIANHEVSYDWLHALSGDLRQVLESVESEARAQRRSAPGARKRGKRGDEQEKKRGS